MRFHSPSLAGARKFAALAAAALVVACGSSTTTPPTPGTLGLAVAPTSVTVLAGAAGVATATITRGGSFTGAVALTQSGAPAGVTVAFASASIASDASTSAIAITVGASVAAGTYPVTISAAGTGVTTATATLSVVVPAPSTLGLLLTPQSLNVLAGDSGSAVAAITRGGGFTGVVTLAQAGTAPTGITTTIATTSLAAGVTSSAIKVVVASTVAAGSYPVIISAAGTGVTTIADTLAVVVGAAGAGSFTLAATPTTLPAATAGGAAVTSNLAIVRTAPFTGAVALTATITGAPAGITASVAPATIAGGATTAVLSVTASSSAVNGSYSVVVRGTSAGVSDEMVTVTGTVTGGVTPAATIALSPTAGTVVAGGSSITSTATITRTGGFTGDVTLSQNSAQAGITVAFAPSTVPAGVTSSTITFTAASTITAGTYPIAITATGTGIATVTATYSLTVTVTPPITLTLSPTSGSAAPGGSTTATATIVRGGGFTGAVGMSALGAPAGVSIAYNPASIPAGSTTSVLTFNVASTVAPGSYSIPIYAGGSGVASGTANFTLNVSAPSSNVSITYCTADAPIWVAVQDGNSAWQRVPPAASGTTYSFAISSGKGGIAEVDTVGGGYNLSIIYATAAEFNAFGGTTSYGRCGAKTVTGSVANVLSPSQYANVALGYSSVFVIPAASSSFTLRNVATGAQDLFASRLSSTFAPDKIILRRGLNVADGGSLAVLDFNASEAFAPATGTVSITGLGADTASILTVYTGNRGSTFGLLGTISKYVTGAANPTFYAVPGSQLQSGELQQLQGNAEATGDSSSSRSAGVYFASPGASTVAFGAALSTPSVGNAATAPYRMPSVTLAQQSSYNRYFTEYFNQVSSNRAASIIATVGYNGSGAWVYPIPDFTGVNGWSNTWGLTTGVAIDWSVSAQGGALFYLDTSIASGSTFQSATKQGTLP